MAEKQLGASPSDGTDDSTKSYVDAAIAASRYSATIGDGATTSFTITHNLGTRSVAVTVYNASTYKEVECDKVHSTANTVTLGFGTAPATGAYVVAIMGGTASGGATISSADISDSTLTGRGVLTAVDTASARSVLGVGYSDSATLTNKTINGSNNTLSNIPTAALVLGGVQTAVVATSESTSSSSYTNLTTTTDSVTVTVGDSGMVMVILYAARTASGGSAWLAYDVSGANTASPTDAKSTTYQNEVGNTCTRANSSVFVDTGLTPGLTTYKLKYRSTGGTSSFSNRRITVIPL